MSDYLVTIETRWRVTADEPDEAAIQAALELHQAGVAHSVKYLGETVVCVVEENN